jgi:hypothetical protein
VLFLRFFNGCRLLFIRQQRPWEDRAAVSETAMTDILYIAAAAGFFLAGALYVRFCNKL